MRTAPEGNIFGKILSGELPSHELFSNDRTYAFLDIYPQNRGHTLLIPRNYSANLFEAEPDDIRACMLALRIVAPAVQAAVQAPGLTVMTNTGKDAGQMIEYLHFHIIPRFPGDEVSLYRLGPQEPPEVLEEIAAQIRARIG